MFDHVLTVRPCQETGKPAYRSHIPGGFSQVFVLKLKDKRQEEVE